MVVWLDGAAAQVGCACTTARWAGKARPGRVGNVWFARSYYGYGVRVGHCAWVAQASEVMAEGWGAGNDYGLVTQRGGSAYREGSRGRERACSRECCPAPSRCARGALRTGGAAKEPANERSCKKTFSPKPQHRLDPRLHRHSARKSVIVSRGLVAVARLRGHDPAQICHRAVASEVDEVLAKLLRERCTRRRIVEMTVG